MAVFKRKIYKELLDWKNNSAGSHAVLIEGARRVGKTTVVQEFAKNEYKSHIYIDFSRKNPILEKIFEDYGYDLDAFFLNLERISKKKLYPRESLIVFDEIQKYPTAREMIKHLVADGRYDYIETGSLLSIKKNVKDIMIPSEEDSISMHPMDFEEFLWATGDEVTVPMVKECFDKLEPMGRAFHKDTMEKYRLYMTIGGMPQAVSSFIEDRNFRSVEYEKKSILSLYSKDAVKTEIGGDYRSGNIIRKIPALLSKHDKSFSPSEIMQDSRTRDYLESIRWLEDSRMVNVCIRTSCPDPMLGLNLDYNDFKLYLLDTGLLLSAAFVSDDSGLDSAYDDILMGKDNFNQGMLFENMVAQELTARDDRLVFAKFHTSESDNIQEVDFLVRRNGKISAIECKSGRVSSRHTSLDRFLDKFKDVAGRAYVVHSKDLRVDGDVVYIPIYMTMFI